MAATITEAERTAELIALGIHSSPEAAAWAGGYGTGYRDARSDRQGCYGPRDLAESTAAYRAGYEKAWRWYAER